MFKRFFQISLSVFIVMLVVFFASLLLTIGVSNNYVASVAIVGGLMVIPFIFAIVFAVLENKKAK